MRKDQGNPDVRITNQFHDKQGMVYDLRCGGVMVVVTMVDVDRQTEWRATATARILPDPPVATAVGPNRAEAFSNLREAWCAQREGVPFPRLDWEAIRQALATVRAI
jgi:hypothetical protein